MMTQENYVKIKDLHAQGWTIVEIAEETGFHPATVSKYLKRGVPPERRESRPLVMTDCWLERIEAIVEKWPRMQAVSIYHRLVADGFAGSYSTVVRAVREIRGPRFRAVEAVSVPIHTDPGEEAQFDFCDLSAWARRVGWNLPLVCFGVILSWSRWRMWWFTTSEDREHTFEGLARFFDQIGGVPTVCRTDRMGALGRSQGRRFELHAPTVGFAAHHGLKIASCQAGDAKRKGKVERPFRSLQETFLPEVEADGVPDSLGELNRRATVWLADRVLAVESRSTGAAPVDRLAVERGFLGALPRQRFDTDYVETRRVHNILPFVSIDANRYSVPPAALGHKVEIRRRVDGNTVEIRLAGKLIATHNLVGARRVDVWDPEHRQAAEALALGGNTDRPDLRVIANDPPATPIDRLDLGGDYDVDEPDLGHRYGVDGEVSA